MSPCKINFALQYADDFPLMYWMGRTYECNSCGKEFHSLAPIKVVDFKPKFVVFLRGTTTVACSGHSQAVHIITYDEKVTYMLR